MCSRSLLRRIVFLLLTGFLICVHESYASAPIITSSLPSILTPDTSFSVSATMSGLSHNAIYRLRIVLAPTGTSNYFGSTYNGTNWYNGTPSPINYANFLAITTDTTGAWWGSLQGKIDSDDPNFTTGNGTYDIKLGRYTQTGSTATWSDPTGVSIAITPQPTDVPTPLPTATPTPFPKQPTAITVPTVVHVSSSPIATPGVTQDIIGTFGAVLGATSPALLSVTGTQPTRIAAVVDKRQVAVAILPLVFILGGFGLLSSCGILFALQTEKGRAVWKKFF